MSTKKIGIIAAAIIIAIMLIGEVYIYTFSANDTYTAVSSEEADGIHYTVGSKISNDYDAILLDNGDFAYTTEYYILDDRSYAGCGDSGNTNQIFQQMKKRGIELKTVSASVLKDAMKNNLSSDVRQCLIAVGTLPDIIYSGHSSDLLFQWINHGGRLYWVESAIGSYYSAGDSLVSVENHSELFFGIDCIDHESRISDKILDNDGTKALKLCNSQMKNSIILNRLGSGTQYLAIGYYESGCASDVLIKFGDGMICSISGRCDDEQLFDLGQIIASGICYKTKIVGHDSGSVFRNTVSGAIGCNYSELRNMTMYIYLGGHFLEYARCKVYHGAA